jgi:hypothetical protein
LPLSVKMSFVDLFHKVISFFQNLGGRPDTTTSTAGDLVSLSEALLRDAKALQSENAQDDQILRKSMAMRAKRILADAMGPEAVIPGYAVAVSLQ